MEPLSIESSQDIKHPDEVLDRAVDFSERIGETTLAEIVSLKAFRLPSRVDATSQLISDDEAPDIDGKTVTYRMVAGQTHPDWRIDIVVKADDDQEYAHSVLLTVQPAYRSGAASEGS